MNKKLKLGDKRLEVNILIGSKVMRPFEANILPSTANLGFGSSSYECNKTIQEPKFKWQASPW